MAIPSGSGSEVLKNASILAFSGSSNDPWAVNWGAETTSQNETHAVPTNHIITVLSFSFCNTHATNGYMFNLMVKLNGGSSYKFILNSQLVAAKETFVWNDKIVLHPADRLLFDDPSTDGGDDADIVISYIDQNWEN